MENIPTPAPEVKVVKKINFSSLFIKKNLILAGISIAVVIAGILFGWLVSGVGKLTPGSGSAVISESANEAGVADESVFTDSADGILKEGGINGEGTYHLERGVGPSQWAYLTSSVVDLSKFVDKKVMVWGVTVAAKKAPWLIDVGKIKTVE